MSDPARSTVFRQPGLDPGQGSSSPAHPEPVEGRAKTDFASGSATASGLRNRVQGMIFSTPMVKALQAGRKTQTRRLLPEGRTPRLKVGDRVYVRETFRIAPDAAAAWPHEAEPCPGWIEYAAGGSHWCFAPDYLAVLKAFGNIPVDWDALPQRWRPSRIAPRWTSRMYLTITDVRVQQLHDIDEADCIAEGIYQSSCAIGGVYCLSVPGDKAKGGATIVRPTGWERAEHAYMHLWDQLNTKPGTRWDDNPQIVAYTFTVTRRNIDVLPMAPGYFAESTPRHPGLDPGSRFPSPEPAPAHPEPVEGRALIEGNLPPHIAAQLIRASDLPQPERKAS